jgi:uncharacterized membrane protein
MQLCGRIYSDRPNRRILAVTPFAVAVASLRAVDDSAVIFELLQQAYLCDQTDRDRNLRVTCLLNRLAGFNGSPILLGHAIDFVRAKIQIDLSAGLTDTSFTIIQLFSTPAIRAIALHEHDWVQTRT